MSYRCEIKAGTRWVLVGEIDQGEVFKPLDQVVNVVSQHADEAYLAVSSGSIAGFYLPARGNFAPAAHPLDLAAAQPLSPSQGAPLRQIDRNIGPCRPGAAGTPTLTKP